MIAAAGTAFGRYQLLRAIASDAVSTTYFATVEAGLTRSRSAGGNHFAVRIAHRVDPNDQDAIDKARAYLTQAQQAGIVDHPTVVRPRDAGIIDGQAYVATSFVRAVPLGDLLAHGGTINQSAALAMFAQLAGALDVAHRAGVVHGALSPRTIWVGPSPGLRQRSGGPQSGVEGVTYVAYLTGFGTATLLRDRMVSAPPGAPAQDLLYVAPEQVRGDPISGYTDQYALACAVYHTLAGHPPFERDTRSKLYGAHLLTPPPQLVTQGAAGAPATSAALLTAMSKDPEDRHPTCGALIHEALPAEEPTVARRAPTQPVLRRSARREAPPATSGGKGWRSWWPFALAALAAAAAFAALWVVNRPDSDRQRTAAQEVAAKVASQPLTTAGGAPNSGGSARATGPATVWDAPVGSRPITQIEVVGNALVVADSTDVAVIERADGAVRWRQKTSGAAQVAGNRSVVAFGGGVLSAVDLASGETSWTADDLVQVQSLAPLDQTIVAATGDQSIAEITAVDRTDGAPIWTETVASAESDAAPTVAAGNHRAYVLHGTTLASIDPSRAAAGIGGLIWQQEVDRAWPVLVPAGKAVIMATRDGRVCRYAGTDGALRWCKAVPGVQNAQPHIAVGGGSIVIATSETVVALDPATGRPAWSRSPDGPIAQVAAGSARVVIGGGGGVRVLDARTGDVAADVLDVGTTALATRDGRLYVGSHSGGVTAIDLRDLS